MDSEDLTGKDAVDAFERHRKAGGPFSSVGRLPKTGAFEGRRRTPPRVATETRNGCDDSARTILVTGPPSQQSTPVVTREPSTDTYTSDVSHLIDSDLEANVTTSPTTDSSLE